MADYSVGQRISFRNNAERNKIRNDLRKQGLGFDNAAGNNMWVVPKGYYRTNTGKFLSKSVAFERKDAGFQAGSDAILGKAIERAETRAKIGSQSPRDVAFDSKGSAISKAFEVQSKEEKERTARISSRFVSEQGEYKYKGGNNGRVSTGTDFRFNNDGGNNIPSSVPSRKDVAKEMPGYLKPADEVYGKQDIYSRLEAYSDAAGVKGSRNPLQSGFYEAKRFGAGVLSAPVLVFTRPKQFLAGTWAMFSKPKESALQIGESLRSDSSFFIGQQVGFAGTFKGLGKVGTSTKNVYVATGSKFVKPESVFDVGVLKGKTTFPMSNSITESLSEFGKSNKVVSASPQKIGKGVVGVGKKAGMGLEDAGIYVTPKGRGSPKFLGVDRYGGEFTLNPLSSLKQSISLPTVTEFSVKGVRLQPRAVVQQPPIQMFPFQKKSFY